jgi:hypothetical protein
LRNRRSREIPIHSCRPPRDSLVRRALPTSLPRHARVCRQHPLATRCPGPRPNRAHGSLHATRRQSDFLTGWSTTAHADAIEDRGALGHRASGNSDGPRRAAAVRSLPRRSRGASDRPSRGTQTVKRTNRRHLGLEGAKPIGSALPRPSKKPTLAPVA